jgi:hypothetical protein
MDHRTTTATATAAPTGGTVHTGGGAVHIGAGAVDTGGGAVHIGAGVVGDKTPDWDWVGPSRRHRRLDCGGGPPVIIRRF